MKIVSVVFLFFTFSINVISQDQFIEKMNDAKEMSKNDLGDLNYDGSKSTYFQVKDELTFKEVEIAVFLRDNYHLFFNGYPAPSKVTIRIYDKPADNPDRIMLWEIKNISGKRKSTTIDELKKMYGYYVEDPNSLKSIFVDYEIHKGDPSRGGVVLVLGY